MAGTSSSILANCPIANRRTPLRIPKECDWDTLHPEIERLYVREQRTLQYIMRYVEMEFGFKATKPMYKKRFAKWGLQKNTKRVKGTLAPISDPIVRRGRHQSRHASEIQDSVANPPPLSNEDRLRLAFLTSVRTWGFSFFESIQVNSRNPSDVRRFSSSDQSPDINSMFKLSLEMLNRGQGVLAGRLARKGFLLMEEMLAQEGPAFVWNMLEIIYDLVGSRKLQLMHLLLVHLNRLAKTRIVATHPLRVMLESLGALFVELQQHSSIADTTSTISDPFDFLLDAEDTRTVVPLQNFAAAFLTAVEQAWTLNAEIVFDKFDYRLFQLYVRLHWDSCSLKLSSSIVAAAKRWFDQVKAQQNSGDRDEVYPPHRFIQITPFTEDQLLERIFAAPKVGSPAQSFNYLHECSIVSLEESANYLFHKDTASAHDTKILLRVLAGLVTARAFGDWPANVKRQPSTDTMARKVSRGHVEVIALALEASRDLHNTSPGLPALWNAMARTDAIANLHEYANAETDPRAIREMWLIQDALVSMGDGRKAWEIEQKAWQRLEMLVKDVPYNSI